MPTQVGYYDTERLLSHLAHHILVNYMLRGGKLFNMVLLVPDDIPEESLASTVEGNMEELCSLFEGWDPR